jgi:hypothetical protein
MIGNKPHGVSKMSEKSDGKSVVDRTLNWQSHISAIAGPRGTSDTRESWLARASRKTKVPFRQIKALYYGECKDPKTSVAISVLSAADQARAEASELATRFESLAGAMNASDPDFYSEDVLTLIHAARQMRGLDRT